MDETSVFPPIDELEAYAGAGSSKHLVGAARRMVITHPIGKHESKILVEVAVGGESPTETYSGHYIADPLEFHILILQGAFMANSPSNSRRTQATSE
jgi:hypothetical protein